MGTFEYVAAGILSWVGLNGVSTSITTIKSYNGQVEKPIKPVSVILPILTIDEPLIPKVMNSIFENNVIKEYPDMFEFILVTDPEFKNNDCYYYYFDKIINAPYGKLTARDMAIKQVSNDIIVAIDVDRYYPPNWLNELLKPFTKPGVVGTTSYIIYHLFDVVSNLPRMMYYSNKMDGGGSAFLKDAYFDSGGFNLNVNQFDWDEMISEEEFEFKKRLEMVGQVQFVPYPNFSIVRPSTPIRLNLYSST